MTFNTLLVLLLVALFVYLANRSRSSGALYSDKGITSKVFFDRIRRIKAKPDRLEGTKQKAKLLEFKSRESRVYSSDIAQALASVLAARAEGYNVQEAVISTGNGKEKSIALGDDQSVEKRIRVPLNNARIVASGGIPKATPHKNKCRSCGYSRSCKHSAA